MTTTMWLAFQPQLALHMAARMLNLWGLLAEVVVGLPPKNLNCMYRGLGPRLTEGLQIVAPQTLLLTGQHRVAAVVQPNQPAFPYLVG